MFRKIKLNLLKHAVLALLPVLAHLKFSTAAGVPSVSLPDLASVFSHWQPIAAMALYYYELLARAFPTFDNYSLFHLVGIVLNALAPNHAADGLGNVVGTHEVDEYVYPVHA